MGLGTQTHPSARLRLVAVLFAILMLTSLAVFPVGVEAQSGTSLVVEDQLTDGHYVYLDELTMAYGGWLDIQTGSGEVLWSNRDSTALPYLEPGETYSGWMELATPLTHNQTLTAIAFNDTNQNGVYDREIDTEIRETDAWMTVQIRSTFDAGPENWMFVRSTSDSVNDYLREPQEPDHVASGGASNGYITASDDLNGAYWDGSIPRGIREWTAPAYYLGNRSNFYGGTFAFKARGTVDWQSCAPGSNYEARPTLRYDVSFYNGDRELQYRFKNTDYDPEEANSFTEWYSAAPGVEWTGYRIPISAPETQDEKFHGTDDGRWDYYEVRNDQRGAYAEELTEETFLDVFSNLTRIEITAESVGSFSRTDCEADAETDENHLDSVVWNVAHSAEDSTESSGEESDSLDDQSTDSDGGQMTTELDAGSEGDSEYDTGDLTTETEGPGFTGVGAILGLIGVVILVSRRRRD